jgi:hypothetical protein
VVTRAEKKKSFSSNSEQKTCIYFFRQEHCQHPAVPVFRRPEVNMLSKCANPSCSTPLVYLREGKIFMVEPPSQPQKAEQPPSPEKSKFANRVEHFWLCGPCSSQMTLAYDRQNGVQVIPKKFRTLAAAS